MNSDLSGQRLFVGIKQATKAVKTGKAVKAYVANGVEMKMRNAFVKLCKLNGVSLEVVKSADELGAMCGIEVAASVAAVAENWFFVIIF